MDTEKLRVVISGAADGLLKAISKASGKIADMVKVIGKLSNSSDKGKKSQDGLAKDIETTSEALDKAKDASMSLADSSKKAEQTVSSLNQSMKELSQSKTSGKDIFSRTLCGKPL